MPRVGKEGDLGNRKDRSTDSALTHIFSFQKVPRIQKEAKLKVSARSAWGEVECSDISFSEN